VQVACGSAKQIARARGYASKLLRIVEDIAKVGRPASTAPNSNRNPSPDATPQSQPQPQP